LSFGASGVTSSKRSVAGREATTSLHELDRTCSTNCMMYEN